MRPWSELKDKGLRLAITEGPGNAIAMAADGHYDAVLLNAEIEGLTSPDSIALFKECDPKCLIILMSREGGGAANSVLCATLQKPFKVKDVISILDRVRAHRVQTKFGDQRFKLKFGSFFL